jgi:hypothetical protein
MTNEPAPLHSREKPALVAWLLGGWVAILGTAFVAAVLASIAAG